MASVSNEMKGYFVKFEKLIEPLVTNKSLEVLSKLKLTIFFSLIKNNPSIILKLIEKLKSIISIHENTIDQLLVKCDNNE